VTRPRYDDLHDRPGRPDRTSWGLWGADDEVGALNDVTREHVADAARSVTAGKVFPLNWDLRLPDPPLFGRRPLRHTVTGKGHALDDHYTDFWPQGSSQWDGLAHVAHPEHGFYGGRTAADVRAAEPRNGVDAWARRGIAGRFVLADVARWRAASGRPLDPSSGERVPAADVAATLAAQGAELRPGDVLLLRFGWIAWYAELDRARRARLAGAPGDWHAAGLSPEAGTARWLWDSGVVAVAADNPAVEAVPFPADGPALHVRLLAMLGIPLGELWDLEGLAADCAADGRFAGLLVSAPLNLRGGVGSPANAVALK
jgi:kynurenine formamidase